MYKKGNLPYYKIENASKRARILLGEVVLDKIEVDKWNIRLLTMEDKNEK